MSSSTSVLVVHIEELGSLAKILEGVSDPHTLAILEPAKRRMLESNPAAAAGDPALFLAVSGPPAERRVVGRIDVVPGRVLVGDQRQRIWYGSDFRVPVCERGTMAALLLVAELRHRCGIIAASGPSRIATELYSRLGWRDVPLTRMVIPVNPLRALSRLCGSSAAGRLAGFLAPWFRPVSAFPLAVAARVCRRYGVDQSVTHWESSLEDICNNRIGLQGPVRDAAWLRWLLDNQRRGYPEEGARVLVSRDTSGSARSLVLISTRRYSEDSQHPAAGLIVASIKDWWCADGRDLSTVVAHAVSDGIRQRVDCIEICVPEGMVGNIRRGFPAFRRGAQRMLFELRDGDPILDSLTDLRAGDGEAFWS